MRRKEEEYERKRIQQEQELQEANSEYERLLRENNEKIVLLQETEKEREQLSTLSAKERDRIDLVNAKRIETLQQQLEENRKERKEMEEKRQALRCEVERQCSIDMETTEYTLDYSEEQRAAKINHNLKPKLDDLRADLDRHKNENKRTRLDILHAEIMAQGRDKYKTLNQISEGNTKSRINKYEKM